MSATRLTFAEINLLKSRDITVRQMQICLETIRQLITGEQGSRIIDEMIKHDLMKVFVNALKINVSICHFHGLIFIFFIITETRYTKFNSCMFRYIF